VNLELLPRESVAAAEWREVDKGSRRLVELADRHYTRQKVGARLATRPGVNLCLLLSDGTAAWVVWRPIPEVGRKDGLEAWECTLFRNEGSRLSSTLISEAAAATFRRWGWPPRDGLISAVGIQQTRRRRSRRAEPGHCFRVAGWVEFEHPSPDKSKVWLRAPHPVRTETQKGSAA
jgi:hypothetical protein